MSGIATWCRRRTPPPTPLSGGLSAKAAYEADPIGFLTLCTQRHGDVFRFDRHLIVVNDPRLIQKLLARTNRDSVPDPDPLDGGRAPSPEQTREWMDARAAILRVMRPSAVDARLPLVVEALDRGLRELGGAPFDPVEHAWEVCLRATLPLCLPDPAPELVSALLAASGEGRGLVDAAVRVPRWLPSRRRRAIRAAGERVRAELRRAAERAPVPSGGPSTLLDELRDPGAPVAPATAERAMVTALLGAIPAMGGAWCWLVRHLATRPEALERVRAEAGAAEHPYTTAFAQEVLRVSPPAWLLGRDTTTPMALAGAEVPAGTAILFSPYLLHRDPRWWADPGEFTPERWLAPEPPHAPHAYLPFGAGPRVCLGAHLGLLVLVHTALLLATRFRPRVLDPDRISPRFGSVLLPENLTCVLRPTGP